MLLVNPDLGVPQPLSFHALPLLTYDMIIIALFPTLLCWGSRDVYLTVRWFVPQARLSGSLSLSLSLFLARHIEVVHEIEFANCVNTDISVSFIF